MTDLEALAGRLTKEQRELILRLPIWPGSAMVPDKAAVDRWELGQVIRTASPGWAGDGPMPGTASLIGAGYDLQLILRRANGSPPLTEVQARSLYDARRVAILTDVAAKKASSADLAPYRTPWAELAQSERERFSKEN